MLNSKNISRRFSLCTVMQAIINCAPISRASVSKQTGLSKQTVSEIVLQLEQSGWIRETGKTSGHVGRTAITYEVVPEAAYVASVDLGGTKVRVSIADLACNIYAEEIEPTDARGHLDIVHQISKLCWKALKSLRIDPTKLAFVVIGVPGVPDIDTGYINMAPNIIGINKIDFAETVEAELGVSVLVENDVNLAVLGEHWMGCGEDSDNLVFVSLGTGIGAGLIVNGALVKGSEGVAGELGYLPFGADPFEPESRTIGALERGAGTAGILARYKKLTGVSKTVPEIFELANSGDLAADQVLSELAKLLARMVVTLDVIINPSLVVFGGSIGLRRELVDRVVVAVAECSPSPVQIEISILENRAALIGGVVTALTQLHQLHFADGLPGVDILLPQPNLKLVE